MPSVDVVAVFVVFGVILGGADALCGQRFHHQTFPPVRGHPEIVGGRDAVRGAYPWQVRL